MNQASADTPVAPAATAASDDVIKPHRNDDDDDEHDDESHHEPLAPGDRKFGVGDVDIYARYAQAARGGSANGLTNLGTVGMDVHGLYGKQSGYAFGLGFDLGVGVSTSFVYGARISPIGWGVAIGPSGYLMLLGGVGFDGATSRVPLSGILPVQLLLAFDVTSRARLVFDAGLTWTTNSDRLAAHNLTSADELDLGTSIRIGTGPCECGEFTMGRGYFFRIDRKEQMNTTFYGFSLGLEIDGAG